jgi:hypothetical protein
VKIQTERVEGSAIQTVCSRLRAFQDRRNRPLCHPSGIGLYRPITRLSLAEVVLIEGVVPGACLGESQALGRDNFALFGCGDAAPVDRDREATILIELAEFGNDTRPDSLASCFVHALKRCDDRRRHVSHIVPSLLS